MISLNKKEDEEEKAPDAHSHTPPGAEGWKDVLQLLKEQSVKMEKLSRALSVIQQGMLRNNPGHVKDSVSEATEHSAQHPQVHTRKRGGNPEKGGMPPRFEKDGYLSETAFRVSGRYPEEADKGGEEAYPCG